MSGTIACAAQVHDPAAPVYDLEPRTLSGFVYRGSRYDSNVFRLADSADANAVLGTRQRSDRITASGIGIAFDKTYGLQRFRLDASRTFYRYTTFGYLDFDPTAYRGSWQWVASPRLSGHLRFDRRQSLTDFADYLVFSRKNVRTEESRAFDVEASALGRWHPLASISELRLRNSEVFRAEDAFTQHAGELGIKYLSPAGDSLSLFAGEARGDYTDRVLDAASEFDTRFTQKALVAKLFWQATGKTSIAARIGSLERRHPHFGDRDYRGAVGGVDLVWESTAKTQLTIRAARDLASFQNSTSSYYVSDSVGVIESWRVSDKTSLSLAMGRSRQSYRGGLLAAAPGRSDRLRSYELAANWEPTRHVAVKASVASSERTSTLPSLQYSDRIVKLTAQLRF